MNKATEAIAAALFREDVSVYAVLDGASIPDLLARLDETHPPCECLIRGELAPDLAVAAPYLVELERGGDFALWLMEKGWGQHWGIFALAACDLRAMRQHFRSLLTVYDEGGKPMFFRFYDPRVMRTYLPTCEPDELGEFFGPVAEYVAEAEDPQSLLTFRVEQGALAAGARPLPA
jgi:hypothetical protein